MSSSEKRLTKGSLAIQPDFNYEDFKISYVDPNYEINMKREERKRERREKIEMGLHDKQPEPSKSSLLPPNQRPKIGPKSPTNSDTSSNSIIYDPIKFDSKEEFIIFNGIIYMKNENLYYPLEYLSVNTDYIWKILGDFDVQLEYPYIFCSQFYLTKMNKNLNKLIKQGLLIISIPEEDEISETLKLDIKQQYSTYQTTHQNYKIWQDKLWQQQDFNTETSWKNEWIWQNDEWWIWHSDTWWKWQDYCWLDWKTKIWWQWYQDKWWQWQDFNTEKSWKNEWIWHSDTWWQWYQGKWWQWQNY